MQARSPISVGLLHNALRSLEMVHQFEDLLAREHVLLLLYKHRLWVVARIGLRSGVGYRLGRHRYRSRRRHESCWFHVILL